MIAKNIMSSMAFSGLQYSKADTLARFCDLMRKNYAPHSCYQNYFLCCENTNGLNQFDILRFSDNSVLNIQLISQNDFAPQQKWQYIEYVLTKNTFYLQSLKKEVFCYCYCLDDGLYKYSRNTFKAYKVDFDVLLKDMLLQEDTIQYIVDIDNILNHFKFLVSPFNNTYAFSNDQYYLTQEQQNVIDDILLKINTERAFAYCLYGSSGSGKSLLLYHFAKQLIRQGKSALIIHNGIFNDALLRLKLQCGFNICSAKEMALTFQCLKINSQPCAAIILDDAHCFTSGQLNLVLNFCREQGIPLILTCNMHNIIYKNADVYNYLCSQSEEFKAYKSTLKNKIRYNKQTECYIENFLRNVNIKDNSEYTIDLSEYIISKDAVKSVLRDYELRGYKIINVCYKDYQNPQKDFRKNVFNTHGSEFEKLIVVIDTNIGKNSDNNALLKPLYCNNKDFLTALYKAITSATIKLKIVAF